MDAQQRLLLERSWEVLPNGPQQDVSPAGATSVFVGIGTVEYTAMASHLGIGIYMATGQLCVNLVLSFPEAPYTPVLTIQPVQQLCCITEHATHAPVRAGVFRHCCALQYKLSTSSSGMCSMFCNTCRAQADFQGFHGLCCDTFGSSKQLINTHMAWLRF